MSSIDLKSAKDVSFRSNKQYCALISVKCAYLNCCGNHSAIAVFADRKMFALTWDSEHVLKFAIMLAHGVYSNQRNTMIQGSVLAEGDWILQPDMIVIHVQPPDSYFRNSA